MTRENILNEVLQHYREIERLQETINKLHDECKKIVDNDDDEDYKKRYGYLYCVESYTN